MISCRFAFSDYLFNSKYHLSCSSLHESLISTLYYLYFSIIYNLCFVDFSLKPQLTFFFMIIFCDKIGIFILVLTYFSLLNSKKICNPLFAYIFFYSSRNSSHIYSYTRRNQKIYMQVCPSCHHHTIEEETSHVKLYPQRKACPYFNRAERGPYGSYLCHADRYR